MTIEQQIDAALDTFWDECSLCPSPGVNASIGVEDLVVPLDSLTAVEVLVTITRIVGVEIPNCVLKKGGYQSKEEFVRDLGDQIKAYISPR